jgi:hypothetical protein
MLFFYVTSLAIEEAMELCGAGFDLWQPVQRDPISFVFEERPRLSETAPLKL